MNKDTHLPVLYPALATCRGSAVIRAVKVNPPIGGSQWLWEMRDVQTFLISSLTHGTEDDMTYATSSHWLCDHLHTWEKHMEEDKIMHHDHQIHRSKHIRGGGSARKVKAMVGPERFCDETSCSTLAIICILSRFVARPRKAQRRSVCAQSNCCRP